MLKRLAGACLLFLIIAICSGCSSLAYYQQAVFGQIELLSKKRDLVEVLSDVSVPLEVREKLRLAQRLTTFAEARVGLPVGSTFDSYADIDRPYVVWNVFSAREFSLTLETYCYPVAGCVAYKGFFEREDAVRFADERKARGYEVYMGGVTAYSTLGWFADPLLNTFIYRAEEALASLIFHELAHKLLYVSDDTTFNESFATTVERYAVRLWLESEGRSETYQEYLAGQERRQQVIELILKTRNLLAGVYEESTSDENRRLAKQKLIAALQKEYQDISDNWSNGNEFKIWMEQDINNAKLGAVGAYQQWVPAFEELMKQSVSFDDFVTEAEKIGQLAADERELRMVSLTSLHKPM